MLINGAPGKALRFSVQSASVGFRMNSLNRLTHVSRLAWAVTLSCALFIAAAWTVTLSHMDEERSDIVAQQTLQNATLTRALEEHTIRTLKDIEQALVAIRREHSRGGRQFVLADFVA